MICGEYFALYGGLVLAIPTKKGQIMSVDFNHSDENILKWENYQPNQELWFKCLISLNDFSVIETSDINIAERLLTFLKNAKTFNPNFLEEKGQYHIKNFLEFFPNEGLGSSSSFTNNLAMWSEVNPFHLHFKSFVGSGFDVAIAQKNQAILYKNENQNLSIQTINWKPSFSDEIYFIYLNKKQVSRESIKNIPQANPEIINEINKIVIKISVIDDISGFKALINQIENITSNFLNIPTIKETLFSDYPDVIKSLGAWGGDYIMVLGKENISYFKEKGFDKVYSFDEMVL